jgi:hypothetical protein
MSLTCNRIKKITEVSKKQPISFNIFVLIQQLEGLGTRPYIICATNVINFLFQKNINKCGSK